ncbi:MAG: SEC-C metal-binding domain-containing protein [Pseudomonadota bacterium]
MKRAESGVLFHLIGRVFYVCAYPRQARMGASMAKLGLEPDMPVDISDLETMRNPSIPATSEKAGRNDRCPCGSGKKFKKCWGTGGL